MLPGKSPIFPYKYKRCFCLVACLNFWKIAYTKKITYPSKHTHQYFQSASITSMEPKQLGRPALPSEPPIIEFIIKTYDQLSRRQNHVEGDARYYGRMSVDGDAQHSASIELRALDIHSGKRDNGDQFLELMSETDIQEAMSKNTADKEAAELQLILKDGLFSTSKNVGSVLELLLSHLEEKGSLIQISKWDEIPVWVPL